MSAALIGGFDPAPSPCVLCREHARIAGSEACANCDRELRSMVPFTFAAYVPLPGRVGPTWVQVEARTDSRLDDVRRGELSYVVTAVTDGAGAALDPQVLNNGAAVDAMYRDAWMAADVALRAAGEVA